MSIVGAFDVHRRQITFDYLDSETGGLLRGRIAPACRGVLRRWLAERFAGRTDVQFAVGLAPAGGSWSRGLIAPGAGRRWPRPPTPAPRRGRSRGAKQTP